MAFQVLATSQKLSSVTLEGKDLVNHVHPYTTDFWNSARHREDTQKIFLELRNNPYPSIQHTHTSPCLYQHEGTNEIMLTLVAQI